eukprot:5084967-Prymnesium_polylepis.1
MCIRDRMKTLVMLPSTGNSWVWLSRSASAICWHGDGSYSADDGTLAGARCCAQRCVKGGT